MKLIFCASCGYCQQAPADDAGCECSNCGLWISPLSAQTLGAEKQTEQVEKEAD